MRVLVFCEFASLNGGERSLLEAVRRIPVKHIQVTVAAPAAGPLADALRHYELEHLPLDTINELGVRCSRPQLHQLIAERIAESRAQLVHANSVSMSRLVGPVARRLNVPSIGHLRDMIRLSKAAIADIGRHCRLLAVSGATLDWYVNAGLTESKVRVVYNGVDLERFQPRPTQGVLHRSLDIPPKSHLVTGVGQIGMRKGVDLYVEAAAKIAALRPDVHFLYVGKRYSRKDEAVTFERNVLRAATRGPLNGRFHFLGVRDDVELVLNETTLYVHAARQEPLGRVLLEAGAAATAIIATDVGGTKEIFSTSSGCAELVPPESSSVLATAIEKLLNAPHSRRTMGSNARRRVASAFDAEDAARALARTYTDIGTTTP